MRKIVILDRREVEVLTKAVHILYDAAVVLGWKEGTDRRFMAEGYSEALDLIEDLITDAQRHGI